VYVGAHDLGHRRLVRARRAVGDAAHDDVAVGHHADEAILVDHR
jgi:hypothetical protein